MFVFVMAWVLSQSNFNSLQLDLSLSLKKSWYPIIFFKYFTNINISLYIFFPGISKAKLSLDNNILYASVYNYQHINKSFFRGMRYTHTYNVRSTLCKDVCQYLTDIATAQSYWINFSFNNHLSVSYKEVTVNNYS